MMEEVELWWWAPITRLKAGGIFGVGLNYLTIYKQDKEIRSYLGA